MLGVSAELAQAVGTVQVLRHGAGEDLLVGVQGAQRDRGGAAVTQAEHDAIAAVLASCPDEPVPAREGTAPRTAPASGAGTAQDAGDQGSATPVYANCAAVKAAGAAPIRPGDPGWDPKFDGDGDGVGCTS